MEGAGLKVRFQRSRLRLFRWWRWILIGRDQREFIPLRFWSLRGRWHDGRRKFPLRRLLLPAPPRDEEREDSDARDEDPNEDEQPPARAGGAAQLAQDTRVDREVRGRGAAVPRDIDAGHDRQVSPVLDAGERVRFQVWGADGGPAIECDRASR